MTQALEGLPQLQFIQYLLPLLVFSSLPLPLGLTSGMLAPHCHLLLLLLPWSWLAVGERADALLG